MIGKPLSSEYGSFYSGYVAKVDSDNINEFLEQQLEQLESTLSKLDDEQASISQEPYTWTIKQLVGHLIDGEKVFGYRLHRIASGDPTPLPGFEHEPYVENLDYQNVSIDALASEFSHLRRANLLFLKRLPPEAASRTGVASDSEITVRAQAFIIGGHVQHHLDIMIKRIQAMKESSI